MTTYKHKDYLKNVLPCVGYGIICGSFTGAIIFLFKLAAKKAEAISRFLYGLAKTSLVGILIAFAVLILCACAMALLHRKIPEITGGGIPRSEGILRGMLSFRALKTFFGTFFGSLLSFFCGLPLGSEGPAVLIGTSVGRIISNISKGATPWERYVMTGGAGAGFAIATGAPLSGILFALEEIHKRFTPMLVLTVSLSTLSAAFVNFLLCSAFDISPRLFEIPTLTQFQLGDTGFLLLMGILVAVAVALFDASIYWFSRLTKRYQKVLPKSLKLIVIFVITGFLGLFFADGIYSGHSVIDHLLESRQSVLLLLAILAIRLAMMLLATDSGATGGLFIPTLAVGALVSALFARLLMLMGMRSEIYCAALLLGMCAFLGGTLRSPLTAAVFFVELTGQFTNLFYVALVVFVVTFMTDLVNLTSFYDRVMDDMAERQNKGKTPNITFFEMKISKGAFAVGKAVRDVMWPPASVVVSITRAEETEGDMDNDGEKKLYAGDTLILRARYYDEEEIKRQLHALVGNDSEIHRTSFRQ